MRKHPTPSIVLVLIASLAFMGCVVTGVKKTPKQTPEEILNLAVPTTDMYKTTAKLLTVQELEDYNGFFSVIEKLTGVTRKTNPIILTGEEFNKIPQEELRHSVPKNIKLFRSGFYNSKGHTPESATGVFVAQAILYANKEDAGAGEDSLKKPWPHRYKVVYRKDNVVGSIVFINKNWDKAGITDEFWELVKFAYDNGFKITLVHPKNAEEMPND